jgi:hypothetical protein
MCSRSLYRHSIINTLVVRNSAFQSVTLSLLSAVASISATSPSAGPRLQNASSVFNVHQSRLVDLSFASDFYASAFLLVFLCCIFLVRDLLLSVQLCKRAARLESKSGRCNADEGGGRCS